MPKQLNLGAFLSEQTTEGVVDSHGEFTVSHTQAARKLAKFALPRSAAWVSKLVQAANRWNCGALQLRQTSAETLFHFTLPKLSEIPTEDAIVSALLSGKVGGQSALDAFALALRALVEQAALSFILVADDGDLAPRPIYAGEHYGSISEQARLDPRFNPKPGLSLTVYHRSAAKENETLLEIFARLRGYVQIIDELDGYGYVSAVPILLDGRRVDSLIVASALRLTDTNRPLFFLGLRNLRYSPERLPLPSDFEEKLLSLLSHPRRVTRDYGGELDFAAVFLVAAKLGMKKGHPSLARRSSRLIWVRDGVVVQTETLKVATGGLSLTIFANAAGLTTDLTGMSLTDNDEFRLRRDELLRRVELELMTERVTCHDPFRPDRDAQSYTDEEFDVDQEVRRRIKILVRGSGAGLALTLFNPVLGVPTTLGAIAAAYRAKPVNKIERVLSKSKTLKEAIELDLGILQTRLVAQENPDKL